MKHADWPKQMLQLEGVTPERTNQTLQQFGHTNVGCLLLE
jgi:hypothetical protein